MTRNDSTRIAQAVMALLPEQVVVDKAQELGVVRRQRKVDVFYLVLSLALGFQVGAQRTLQGLRQVYVDIAGGSLSRSAFHGRLNERLAALLKWLVMHTLEAQQGSFRLPEGVLSGFRDLLAIDSTVVRLHQLLEPAFPACRTNHTKAAAKLHVVMSVLDGSAKKVKLSSERVADVAPWRRVESWVRGHLLLFDLGYYRFHLFDRIDAHGGFFLSRMKTNANPLIVATNRRWRGRAVDVVGQRLQDILPKLQREVLDVMVEVSFKKRRYRGKASSRTRTFRLVAVRNDDTGDYHVYLTNLPADRLPAEDVTRTYALRWQVELLFKAMKSHGHLHQLPSRKKAVVSCLIWASILGSLVSQALYREVRAVVARSRHMPPLRWAALFGRVAERMLHVVVGLSSPTLTQRLWQRLLREAPDPNRNRRGRSLPQPPQLWRAGDAA